MTPMEALEKIKDRDFIAWLEKNAKRKDVIDAVETLLIAKNLHPRAIGDLPKHIEPLWNEYLNNKD
jgi:hypothetical protein